MIDTHCHLDLEPLVSHLPQMVREAAAGGVTRFVIPGVHPDGWLNMAAIAEEYPKILVAYGIHPMYAACADDQTLNDLAAVAPRGIAIGETGLDPSYPVPMVIQEAAFREQLRMASKLELPVLIHCRRVFQRTLQILREERTGLTGGIMHAFSGSVEMASEFIRLGFAISVSGSVTWTKAIRPRRLAGKIPQEHLVLETDAPDITPQLYRGRFNRPAWMLETAEKVAEIKGIPLEALSAITTANASRILRLE